MFESFLSKSSNSGRGMKKSGRDFRTARIDTNKSVFHNGKSLGNSFMILFFQPNIGFVVLYIFHNILLFLGTSNLIYSALHASGLF